MTMTSPRDTQPGAEADPNREWAMTLQQFVRILTGYAPMRFVPFYYLKKHGETEENTPRRWRTVLGLEEIQYLPEDLAPEDKDAALGRTAHEVWHVLFSRPELIFDEPELIKSMAFQALWWAVEDPRVNIQGLARHPGAKPWVMAAYARDYEVRNLEEERANWAESVPLHLQFNYALIYQWYKGERDPRVSDPKVYEALDRASDAIRRATHTGDAARSFRIIRDEIWPIYKELVDEAYEREQQKQQGQGDGEGQESDQQQDSDSDSDSQQSSSSSNSSKPGKPGKSGKQSGKQQKKPVSQSVKDKMEQKERAQRDKHASKMVDKPEQMSQSEREKAKREMEQMRKKMGQQQEGQEGKDKAQQAGDPQAGQGEGEGDGSSEMSAEQKAKQRERLSKPDQRPEVNDAEDDANYKNYFDRVKRFVPVARAQMMQVLKRKVRRRTIHDRKSGDLDEESLNELPAGKPDPFTETVSANKSLYRISLLIDTSGSMSGEKRERAIEGAVMMMETLEKLPGVSYEIVAFDNEPRVLKAYNERVTPNIKTAVVKALIKGSGSTESHVAVQQAIQRIRMGRGDKMIIMVNDGDPDYNFDRDQYRAMVMAAKDVEIHGIGLGPEAQLVLDLFPPGRGWWLKDAADFAKNLRAIIKKKLLGGQSN